MRTGGFNLIQGLTCIDIVTFREKAVLDYPSYLWANLGRRGGNGASRQFADDGKSLSAKRDNTDFYRGAKSVFVYYRIHKVP